MIFPLEITVSVLINGAVVRAYNPPLLERGHVVAPIDPFVTSLAERIACTAHTVTAWRGDRFVEVAVRHAVPAQFSRVYVPLAPIAAALGASAQYDAATRRLEIRIARAAVATPTPFNPAVPRVNPTQVFTAPPIATPRPIVRGTPLPRRTPLPAPEPSPRWHQE
ncbi:MAG: hypothetical protein JOZ01_04415 [Candidatus Eremiobacteraeota bacterium]|nr:hypothetical protein [Candidatus Eremiobacteraeota bacterium]